MSDTATTEVPYYEMFTPEGEIACEELVAQIVRMAAVGSLTRRTLREAVDSAMHHAAKTHPEIFDTEPHGEIARQINIRVCKPNMWAEYDRWGDWEN